MAEAEPAQAMVWLERAASSAATAAERSERWLRLADAHEARHAPAKACDALQMILDHESEAWLELPQRAAADGAPLAAGRLSNRALAMQRIECLIVPHGPGVYARAEAAAQRSLTDARKHTDPGALPDLIARYPFGTAQGEARLVLARRHFDAREYDAAIEDLELMLRDEPRVPRAPDAALGMALSAIRANRPAAASPGRATPRHSQNQMNPPCRPGGGCRVQS